MDEAAGKSTHLRDEAGTSLVEADLTFSAENIDADSEPYLDSPSNKRIRGNRP
jgi:hypothetical protein